MTRLVCFLIIFSGTLILCVIGKLLVDLDQDYSWALYLSQLFLIIYSCTKFYSSSSWFFRPAGFLILYLGINFVLGSATFASGLLNWHEMGQQYLLWENRNQTTIFFLLANLAIVSAALTITKFPPKVQIPIIRLDLPSLFIFLVFPGSILLMSLFVEHPLIGPIRMALCITIAIPFFISRNKFRWVLVIFLLFLLSSISFDDKRYALSIIIPLLFIELYQKKIDYKNKNISKIIYLVLLSVVAIYVILAMSIMRGYGNYDTNSIIDALHLVPNYVSSEIFLSLAALNFEYGYVYFHTHNAIELIEKNHSFLAYGESLAKVFFIGIPEELFNYKPASILELYTGAWAPEFRSIGGSYPISLVSEMYWNFWWFGIIALFILILTLEKVASYGVNNLKRSKFFISLYMVWLACFPVLVRGSGLDLFIVVWIVASMISLFAATSGWFLLSILTKAVRR